MHRDGDRPAIIWADGTQWWLQNDEVHRDGDQPAYIGADGTQRWYQYGITLSDDRVISLQREALLQRNLTRAHTVRCACVQIVIFKETYWMLAFKAFFYEIVRPLPPLFSPLSFLI
jgi:hypothetical protein